MKKVIIIAFYLFNAMVSQGQTVSYNLATIPDSIKKNAGVIVQFENRTFTVQDIDEAVLHVRKIYTVVNEEGKNALRFEEYTSKFISLTDAELKVYDATGRLISKHKKKEMMTEAIGDGLIEDGNLTYYWVNASTFPVTVDLEYELKFAGTLFYPSYNILVPKQGVLQSSFVARVPPTLNLRFKEKNITLKPELKDEGKLKTYTWSVKNLIPIEYESGAVEVSERFPSIELAPNKFSFYGYSGDLSTWKNYGLWAKRLYDGMDHLPEPRKAFFMELVRDAKTDREKASLIYNYLQKNFRYVSIQLGIGGFKPFSAIITDEKKYGDCKALSNYMKAALNAVGIKSNVALINAGYNSMPVDPNFPVQTFNHVILCIPQSRDSIWLECTSSTSEFDELSTFTENRFALLLTEEGGVLVPTPASSYQSNVQSIKSAVLLNQDGSGKIETVFRNKGEFRELMNEILKSKIDEQKEAIVYGLSFKQPDSYQFSKSEGDNPGIGLMMEIEKVPDFIAGSKYFLSPRLYKIWNRKLPKSENRRLDFYFHHPFEMIDTTAYVLPEGFKVDVLPPAKEFKNDFASYASKHWYDEKERTVYSTVQVILRQHVIPAAKYAEVKKLFDDILINDGQKIVVKKE